MATVAAVIPVESRRLIPNRGRFTPHIEIGRGAGGWYWRLRLTHLTTSVDTRWTGVFISKGEALSAGLVGFNLVVQRIDGPDGQRYREALDPILEALRESAERR